jgi:hypothetical protein
VRVRAVRSVLVREGRGPLGSEGSSRLLKK